MKTVANVLGVSLPVSPSDAKASPSRVGRISQRGIPSCCRPFANSWMLGRPMAIGGSLPFSTGTSEPPIFPSSIANGFIASWPDHAMIVEKHTAGRIGRVHDGKVMAMRYNLRLLLGRP